MRKELSSSNVLLVGLARNCEDRIQEEIRIINAAFVKAASVKWFVVESDSDDGTLPILNKLAVDDRFDFVSLGSIRTKYPKRTDRIAKCRNRYLEEIKKNPKYTNIDFVVVADLDGVNSKLTELSVNSCWNLNEDWDACFANQSEVYYDIWALRHALWSPNDCWENYNFLINNGSSKSKALQKAVHSRMIKIKNDEIPIEVDSAFGGLGIYKKSVILLSEYIGLNTKNEEFCEHVSFHLNLREKGCRLYIIPSLINCGWNEHSKNIRLISRVKTKLQNFIIRLSNGAIHFKR